MAIHPLHRARAVKVRFRALAVRGSRKTGLALLDKLDRALSKRRRS